MAQYSMWLVQNGVMEEFPRSGLFYGAHNGGTMEVPLGYVVLEGEGHVALVDTGYKYLEYGQQLADQFGVTNWRSPAELLGRLGLAPEDVDTLLVTHAHWDHMGHLAAFPNATIHLQQHELDGWIRALSLPPRHGFLQGGVDPSDFHHLLERSLMGQVRLHDGPVRDVLPGVHLDTAHDTHTHGSQFVVVEADNSADPGTWVLVGDAVFALPNLIGMDGEGVFVPVGQATGSQTAVLEVFDRILDHTGRDPYRVVPQHDMDAYDRFPSSEVFPGLRIAEVTLADGVESRLGLGAAAARSPA